MASQPSAVGHDPVQAGDQRVAAVGPAGQLARHQVRRVLAGLGPDLAAQQRHVDALAPPGPGAGQQRRQHAGHDLLRGDVVGDRRRDRRGLAAVGAGGADQTAGRLGRQVGPLLLGVRADRPEGRAGGVHEAGVAGGEVVVAQAPVVHRPGLEVRDDDVRGVDETAEHVLAARPAQVDRDAALAAVAGAEVGAATVARGDRQPAGLVAPTGQFDLDHVGAELRQHRRRLGALDEQAGLEDADAVEGPAGQRCAHSLMRASERQRARGQRRPAWPGNAMTAMLPHGDLVPVPLEVVARRAGRGRPGRR